MAVVLGISLPGLVIGFANTGIKHLGAEEFIRKAQTMEQMNSAFDTRYIGATENRAYVECTGMYRLFPNHKAIVYWTELDGLPPELAAQLREGTSPWIPWQEKAKRAEANEFAGDNQ